MRVQARDGKILGPAVKKPQLSVRDVLDNVVWLPNTDMDNRSSGTVVPVSQFNKSFSRNAIVVEAFVGPLQPTNPPPQPPGPYWLQPPPVGQGELIVRLPLLKPSLLEFTATAYAPDPVRASATMWVLPGMQLLADPGLVLTIAGLYTTVQASAVGTAVTITATVTMMCGCPITAPPTQTPPSGEELFWPANEFEVTARIRVVGSEDDSVSLPLSFETTNKFTGSVQLAPGTYEVSVVAVQPRETNVGYASATLVVS